MKKLISVLFSIVFVVGCGAAQTEESATIDFEEVSRTGEVLPPPTGEFRVSRGENGVIVEYFRRLSNGEEQMRYHYEHLDEPMEYPFYENADSLFRTTYISGIHAVLRYFIDGYSTNTWTGYYFNEEMDLLAVEFVRYGNVRVDQVDCGEFVQWCRAAMADLSMALTRYGFERRAFEFIEDERWEGGADDKCYTREAMEQ